VSQCWHWCQFLVLAGVAHEDILGLFRRRGRSSGSGKPDIAGNEPGDVLMLEDEGGEGEGGMQLHVVEGVKVKVDESGEGDGGMQLHVVEGVGNEVR
jgi:hypothetical protein